MSDATDGKKESGFSNVTLSFGGIVSIAALLASGVATYNTLQNDIVVLKNTNIYQIQTNVRLESQMVKGQDEHRETMREFNVKLDQIREVLHHRR